MQSRGHTDMVDSNTGWSYTVGGDNSCANMQKTLNTCVDDRHLPISTVTTDKYDFEIQS